MEEGGGRVFWGGTENGRKIIGKWGNTLGKITMTYIKGTERERGRQGRKDR